MKRYTLSGGRNSSIYHWPLAALSEGKPKMTRRPEGGATLSRISVLLAAVYDWFTEGFDTADLKDVKALVVVLSRLPLQRGDLPPTKSRIHQQLRH